MMGHFVNPLPLRFDVSGNPTFRELQLQVRNWSWKVWSMNRFHFRRW